jgi:hypothetical protein
MAVEQFEGCSVTDKVDVFAFGKRGRLRATLIMFGVVGGWVGGCVGGWVSWWTLQ